MVRRSKRLQSILPENNELLQTRLDIGYGIKSNIFVNDLSKFEDKAKKTEGIRTRSMSRADINEKNVNIKANNVTADEVVKPTEIDIASPKKKSKTKLKNSKSSKIKDDKLSKDVENHQNDNNMKNTGSISLPNPKEKLILINDVDILAPEKLGNDETEFDTISQLDSLLPPTAPESQDNSPIREENNEIICEKESSFTNVAELRSENKLEALLSNDYNTNVSTYKHMFESDNISNLNRLKKIKLPEKYECLIEIFQGLEIVLRLLERRQKPFFYPAFIKEQVENISKKTFTLDNLLRIVWISPQLVSVKWCKTNTPNITGLNSPVNNSNELPDQYQLEIILNNGVNNPLNRLSYSNINERIDIFRLILIDFTLIQQESCLEQKVTKNMKLSTSISELNGWSSFFNIEDCVDIPRAKLPIKKHGNYNSEKSEKISEKRISSLSLTPSTRSIYNLKLLSNLTNIEEQLEQEKNNNRRSVSADNAKKEEVRDEFKTPLRNKHSTYEINKGKENDRFWTDNHPSNNASMIYTPIRSARSSYMLSRSISPAVTPNDRKIPLNNTKVSRTMTILSRNKGLLTPSQKDLLESVKRREKIKEISTMINVEDNDFNLKLEQVKDEIWTIQQISFVFLRTKNLIPTTQLPLLAKRLTTYARNSPVVSKVQDSIIRLSNKWPENIKLGDSTVEKGVKLVKLDINDDNLSDIIMKLNQEKELIFKQREEFRLKTISKYQ